MVKPTSPINSNVSISIEENVGSIDGTATGKLTKFIETRKARAVSVFCHGVLGFEFGVPDKAFPLFFGFDDHFVGVGESGAGKYVLADVVFEVGDILGVMKLEEFLFGGMAAFIDVHFSVEVEALDEGVGHGDTSRFHGVLFVVVKFSNLVVIEICHFIMHSQLIIYNLI